MIIEEESEKEKELFSKIINKKIESDNKDYLNKISNYFNEWSSKKPYKNENNNSNNNNKQIYTHKKTRSTNFYSPNGKLRGNKSGKKHIKIKYSRAMTSKTSIGSAKSEDKSHNSSFHTKKMRIKNISITPVEYYKKNPLNKSLSLSFFKYNSNNMNKTGNDLDSIILKVSNVVDKIQIKNIMYKYFKIWKNKK